MAVFNGKLYIAFRADDPSNAVWVASSSDGINFNSQVLSGQTMGGSSSPALAVSNNTLYYIYGPNDTGGEMRVSASTDGSTWQGPALDGNAQMGATGPGATAFGIGVYAGYQSNDSRNVLIVDNGDSGFGQVPGRPCDILASASPATPCVAAFSTTRALYAFYTGPLYSVSRASDGTAMSIGLLSDGYANAAAQDLFCANTVCIIDAIFDQTSNDNDLNPAPPGGQAKGPGPGGSDIGAGATNIAVTAGGHKVYGIFTAPGVGYRNDTTTKIPMNDKPQGVYMVTSSNGLNNLCCFDFGNAKINNDDNKAGHMDAINIMCTGNPCTPVAGLDLEDGIYGGLPVTPATEFALYLAGTMVSITTPSSRAMHNPAASRPPGQPLFPADTRQCIRREPLSWVSAAITATSLRGTSMKVS